VKPALNYYMLHVGMGRDAHGLRTFCDSQGIRTFAYGAVGEPGPNEEILNNSLLKKIGAAHGKLPEEVALRWVLQSGAAASVRPTTNFGLGTGVCAENDGGKCAAGLEKRAGSFGWKLTAKEMALLDAMKGPDDNPTLFSSAGCPGAFVMPK
jgi:aryl-alcohol dehydrogenase-like predicted oxidoreductase